MPEETEKNGNSTKWKVPKFTPSKKAVSEKDEENLYKLNKLNFGESELKEKYESILGPLSLFAPFNHEKVIESVPADVPSLSENSSASIRMERPVTPINDEIKQPPSTYNKLAKLVRRRITAKPEIQHMSVEDQKELAAIIMGEVNSIWASLRMQVDDPFLGQEDNKELQRRIIVHIVHVCEQLFNHYINKAVILNKRGVFSGPANMSRLKAQLALDASKFLHVLTIKRYIGADLRAKDGYPPPRGDETKRADLPDQPAPLLSYKGMMDISRPKSVAKSAKPLTLAENLREMDAQMVNLDTTKLYNILADIPQERVDSVLSVKVNKSRRMEEERKRKLIRKTPASITKNKLLNKKSGSVPNLFKLDALEEFGVTKTPERTSSALNLHFESKPSTKSRRNTDPKPVPGTREYAKEDLMRLVNGTKDKDSQLEDQTQSDDLPALLKAIIMPAKYDGRKEQVMKQLEELERREVERRKQEELHIQPPTHPQPATVFARMPNNMVVKTSDIRVSERICMSNITLHKHSTVYNDLLDEIDPATVKKLDSNLFLGDEITEVYKEIMKTVPTDHLDMQNNFALDESGYCVLIKDPIIEPTADHVSLSQALASSTLTKDPKERIINPKLHRDAEPPWGTQSHREWAKTPQEAIVDMKGRSLLEPMVPRGNRDSIVDLVGAEAAKARGLKPEGEQGNAYQEMMAREYASWWNWWKNTINSDDYMKYLSTQETDYLGVAFHFYNSDDEGEKEEEQLKKLLMSKAFKRARRRDKITAEDLKNMSKSQIAMQAGKLSEQEDKEKQLSELRAKKSEYKDGFWNVNSVLMGGLGKDPEMEGEKCESVHTPPPTDGASTQRTPRSQKTKITTKKAKMLSVPTESEKQVNTARSGSVRTVSVLSSHRTLPTRFNTPGVSDGKTTAPAQTLNPQERLEKVWTQLHMPDGLKLDMAIKYSSDEYHNKLDDAIEDWEAAADLVLKREQIIGKLENFERAASDPNRFFEKGKRGSSNARFKEAKQRQQIYDKLDDIENEIKDLLADIKEDFNDEITYQGRPYLEKMKWDRTEMLFWLQEERKQQAFEYESRMKHLHGTPMGRVVLDPIIPQAY